MRDFPGGQVVKTLLTTWGSIPGQGTKIVQGMNVWVGGGGRGVTRKDWGTKATWQLHAMWDPEAEKNI